METISNRLLRKGQNIMSENFKHIRSGKLATAHSSMFWHAINMNAWKQSRIDAVNAEFMAISNWQGNVWWPRVLSADHSLVLTRILTSLILNFQYTLCLKRFNVLAPLLRVAHNLSNLSVESVQSSR